MFFRVISTLREVTGRHAEEDFAVRRDWIDQKTPEFNPKDIGGACLLLFAESHEKRPRLTRYVPLAVGECPLREKVLTFTIIDNRTRGQFSVRIEAIGKSHYTFASYPLFRDYLARNWQ